MAILRFCAGSLALAMLLTVSSLAQAESVIVSRAEAARHGLNRAWYTQIQLNRAGGRVERVMHAGDTLFVLTNHGLVQSIDANTGRTHWAVEVGRPSHPSMGPAVNDQYLAIVNGSRVYVLERATGRQVWDRQLGDAPGAGPVLSKTHVFVPMISGRIEGYNLAQSESPTWAYYSNGRGMVQPVATEESICWATDKGNVYVLASNADAMAVRFRFETSDAITSSATYAKPYLFVASLDGYVYAVHEQNGTQRWRFSVGDPILEQPVAIGDRLYVCADRGGMYCLSTTDAKVHWWSPRPMRFVSAGENQIYAQDRHGDLIVLDAKTGTLQGSMSFSQPTRMLTNSTTDRILLLSDSGLLQCLHDASLTAPINHKQAAKPADPVQKATLDGEAEPAADEADNPFGGGGNAPANANEDDVDNPFGGGGNAPANDDDGGDNPFGGGNAPANDDGGGNDNPFGGDPFGGGGSAPAEDGGNEDAGDDNPFGANPFGGDNPFN